MVTTVKVFKRFQKPRVTNIEKNGEFVDVRFTRDDGEVVTGMYKLVGWRHPPRDVYDEVTAALRSPPVMVLRTKRG